MIRSFITHRSKESISSYSNGEFFVRRVHCPDNRAKLLHKELQFALMLLNVFSHQDGNLQDDRKSTQTKKKYKIIIIHFNYIREQRTELRYIQTATCLRKDSKAA